MNEMLAVTESLIQFLLALTLVVCVGVCALYWFLIRR